MNLESAAAITAARALLEIPPTGCQIGELIHRAEEIVDRSRELGTSDRVLAFEAETTALVEVALAEGILEPAGAIYRDMGTLYRLATGGREKVERALERAEASKIR